MKKQQEEIPNLVSKGYRDELSQYYYFKKNVKKVLHRPYVQFSVNKRGGLVSIYTLQVIIFNTSITFNKPIIITSTTPSKQDAPITVSSQRHMLDIVYKSQMWRISPNSTKTAYSWSSGGDVSELGGGSPPALQLNSCSPDEGAISPSRPELLVKTNLAASAENMKLVLVHLYLQHNKLSRRRLSRAMKSKAEGTESCTNI